MYASLLTNHNLFSGHTVFIVNSYFHPERKTLEYKSNKIQIMIVYDLTVCNSSCSLESFLESYSDFLNLYALVTFLMGLCLKLEP